MAMGYYQLFNRFSEKSFPWETQWHSVICVTTASMVYTVSSHLILLLLNVNSLTNTKFCSWRCWPYYYRFESLVNFTRGITFFVIVVQVVFCRWLDTILLISLVTAKIYWKVRVCIRNQRANEQGFNFIIFSCHLLDAVHKLHVIYFVEINILK